jgi:hypothetical protein
MSAPAVVRAVSDVIHTALDAVRATGRFPHASYVQHPDPLLKYLDATVVTYKRIQMKQLKQCLKHLRKRLEKHLKTIACICNIQMKHL